MGLERIYLSVPASFGFSLTPLLFGCEVAAAPFSIFPESSVRNQNNWKMHFYVHFNTVFITFFRFSIVFGFNRLFFVIAIFALPLNLTSRHLRGYLTTEST